ncbi:MAG: PCRF domain-containing protein, partial [Gammaproteobacteria bacterium]|nr:PCRF domain-containing protein [Gammaproteobacteria bacterium]
MKASLQNKLESLSDRLEEISHLLADPGVIGDQHKFRSLSQEYAQLDPVVAVFKKYQKTLSNLAEAKRMQQDSD